MDPPVWAPRLNNITLIPIDDHSLSCNTVHCREKHEIDQQSHGRSQLETYVHYLLTNATAEPNCWTTKQCFHYQDRISPATSSQLKGTSTKGSPITALPTPSCRSSLVETAESLPPSDLLSSEASSTGASSPRPPPFSSLYFPTEGDLERLHTTITDPGSETPLVSAPAPSFAEALAEDEAERRAVVESKVALAAKDSKGEASKPAVDDSEPPPPYTEGPSPLDSFAYIMAAAGGAGSIITQVQQTGAGAPINTLETDINADEHITLDLRGVRFTISRYELYRLPEFVLLSLFPSGALPEGHVQSMHEGDVYTIDYDPASLQYMLDFFRGVASSLPARSSPGAEEQPDPTGYGFVDQRGAQAGIIVLREDLDFYAIPPRKDIEHEEMIDVKRAAARSLLKQDGIFSGLRKSDQNGSTEQHLIEMLTAGGFDHDDRWGHRANEPNKAVVCSLALARLRPSEGHSDLNGNNAMNMAQKLYLFWRKPARRCWWEGVELDDVEGVPGKLKVWIRRVWTLEMSMITAR